MKNKKSLTRKKKEKEPNKISRYFLIFIFLIIGNGLIIALLAAQNSKSFSIKQSTADLIEIAKLQTSTFPIKTIEQWNNRKNNDLILQYCKEIHNKTNIRVTIIDTNGVVLGDSHTDSSQLNNHNDRPEVIKARKTGQGKSIRYSESINKELIYSSIPLFPHYPKSAIIRLSIPRKSLKPLIAKSIIILTIVTILFTTFAVIISLVIKFKISKPLKQLSKTALKYAEGDFSEKINIPSPLELKHFSKTLTSMAEKLNNRFQIITEQKNELETVLDNMGDSLILIDERMLICKTNAMTEKLFEMTQSRLIGYPLRQILPDKKLYKTCTKQFQKDCNPTELNIIIKKNKLAFSSNQKYIDEDPISLRINISKIIYQKGQKHLLLIIRNLTRLRKLQKIKTDFISNLSHEMRTPITSINGYAEVLLNNKLEENKRNQFLNKIYRNSVRLTEITNNILTLSKIEAQGAEQLHKEVGSPKLLLKRAVEAARRDYPNFEFKFSLTEEGKPRILQADVGLLMIVFINLIENAIHYKHPLRQCEINAKIIYAEKTINNENFIRFEISDNGIGIEFKNISRVFERFYRTDNARKIHQKGTGLGLAIVKHTVKAHNGRVWVQSDGESGSTFIIEMPIN